MLKLVIFILFLFALYVLWRLVAKHKINEAFDQQKQELSRLVQNTPDEDELPEKTKIIQQMIAEERQRNQPEPIIVEEAKPDLIVEEKIEEKPINDEDQHLFDAAAQLFFEQSIQIKDFHQANQIQHDLLSKMPMNTHSQIGAFDGGEWSVFWSYHDQSLEYYVGRYGVFYAHVDREGIEHKAEFKDSI